MTASLEPSHHSGLPFKRRRRPSTSGLAAPGSPVVLRGIEVTQCVQDMQHSVSLIADKATVVRLYVDPASLGKAATVTGELAWTTGGGETYLPAMNKVRIDPAANLTLNDQRADIEHSLNFRLPPQAVQAGTLNLRLTRIFVPAGGDLPVGNGAALSVTFRPAAPLRIRAIGLRYSGPTGPVAPAAVHFAYFRSYLIRAYPAARVEWSQIVVDANFGRPFINPVEGHPEIVTTADLANAQIAAIRAQEVSGGIDSRTHYYGLVDDNNDTVNTFVRGKAFTIPSGAQPDVVASGPVGVPRGFAGDRDASYADWYSAHELGHTFGRRHPGFPPANQAPNDPNFPYPNGFISTPDQRYVGIDVGDPELGLPMKALPGLIYHDVMTYANDQWLSAYTYEGIFARLASEDLLGP
jgi:hypothetical protein